jgi:MGT family glycosyltransferase
MHAAFDAFCRERGAPGLPDLEFIHTSPYANLYLYPDEVDYARANPLTGWTNLQTSVRATDAAYEIEPGDGALVYLSLGSLASADVELMRGLVDTLAGTPHRYIVSKGPQHDQITLADNMTGAEFLPQTSILPQVDLIITHGGNNTVTEALHFGKPMILMPVFWDQHDNAQRIHETGFGIRLDTYARAPEELTGAIDTLLGDDALRARLDTTKQRLQAASGTETAADAIEQVLRAAPVA